MQDKKVQYKRKLFGRSLKIINIGSEIFLKSFEQQKLEAVQVTWRPPVGGDKELARLLEEIK